MENIEIKRINLCWMCKEKIPLGQRERCQSCQKYKCVACGAKIGTLKRIGTLNTTQFCTNQQCYHNLSPKKVDNWQIA